MLPAAPTTIGPGYRPNPESGLAVPPGGDGGDELVDPPAR
jgi:hypothetical protein